MKKNLSIFLSVGMTALILLGYGYFKSIPAADPGSVDLPRIEITPEFFDFGQVDYGQVAQYDFSVKNTGTQVLEIKRVATSCACTSAEITPDKLHPGEEAVLHVVYDTEAMSGPHGRGEQERIIYIKSSDPVNPQVEVMIYANVK